jgi:hypothetical protein
MPPSFNRSAHVFRSPIFKQIVDNAIQFMSQTPVHPLPPITRFQGTGVYILYYLGDFSYYTNYKAANPESCDRPIYVGKAVPRGWRQARNIQSNSTALYNRLKEHSRSIQQVQNLDINDFRCRFIILDDAESNLIGTIEAESIRRFTPLWNVAIDGFGNHDPGASRYNQAKSEWDVLHPGRPWAGRLTGIAPSFEDIVAKIV